MTTAFEPEPKPDEISAEPTSLSQEILPIDKRRMLPTPSELIDLLSKRVIGQTQAKRALATAVYQHFMCCARSDLHGGSVEAENHVMLLGPSGCGKSLLLRTLGDVVLKVPIFYIPCTTITPDGYKGKNFTQHLDSIAEVVAKGNHTIPCIVVWDECDKLGLYGDNDSTAAIYKRMTQMDFLTYLDGTRCGSEGGLDSSRILNVACGAFVGLDEIRNAAARPIVGFHHAMQNLRDSLEPVTPEHLITYGLIPEFVGRFSRIATLDPLDQAALRRILTEAEGNVLARRRDFFAMHGVRLEFTNEAVDELVAKAVVQGTGARALRQVVDQVLRGVEHRLPDMATAGVNALVIDGNAVNGRSQPIEHKGVKKDLSSLLEIRRHAAYAKQEDIKDEDGDDLCIF